MYKRAAEALLKRFAKIYPVIGITGPRQSGKTTTARQLFPSLPYVTFEDLDVRSLAKNDPRVFLARYEDGAIFDEVQHVPELLSYLQRIVDEQQIPGRFVITSSQNFTLTQSITQSLAGRVGMVTLLPLSMEELAADREWAEHALKGGYPKLNHLDISTTDYYPQYIHTYVERDVRQIKNIGDITAFKNFIRLCAGRIGQVVNLASLAQDAQISQPTARQWLSILEASYIVFTLPTYYKNLNKRRIKMPKIYFYDTGLAASLLGFRSKEQLADYHQSGTFFENLVILEVLKGHHNDGMPPELFFWRDYSGMEVDLIVEWGGVLRAVEIKQGATFQSSFLKHLRSFMSLEEKAHGFLVYNGTKEGSYDGITLVPLNKLFQLYKA